MISVLDEGHVILIQARAPVMMDGLGLTVELLHMHLVLPMLCLELVFRQLEQGVLVYLSIRPCG